MPSFISIGSSYTVTDYVGRIKRKEFVVNKNYQRSDKVWPDAARSFLIESILLGYPIPKISIREITDYKTKTTTGEIIDGQQRTRAIVDFHENGFAISNRSDLISARGCKYDDLDEDLQKAFMSFPLQADVISGATDDEIIELFRRINSHTVALNAEEQRHAAYQGPMKWFIYELARDYGPTLERFGVMTVKQLARMQDIKLMAEITHALYHGITTTAAKQLNQLYDDHNKTFPQRDKFAERFKAAFSVVLKLESIENTLLAKHYHFYCLILALMHTQEAIPTLKSLAKGGRGLRKLKAIDENLGILADVLEIDDLEEVNDDYQDFWSASTQTTNTAANRTVRFKAFMECVSN